MCRKRSSELCAGLDSNLLYLFGFEISSCLSYGVLSVERHRLRLCRAGSCKSRSIPGRVRESGRLVNEATRRVEVVKYATDSGRRAALRREVRAWEAFERGLKSQQEFVRILGSHLTTKPYYVKFEYGGLNLMTWSDAQRTQGGLSREVCLEVMSDLVDAVAAAHSLGVIHNDLKPSNVLISPAQRSKKQWEVKVADFGVASVARENRLADLQLSERTLQPGTTGVGGTSLYHAPEVGPSSIPTPEADVYALGVILFQILCGDYGKTPYPGWEGQIADPILQQDIEAACNLNPARRPKAPILAEWLRTVEERRQELLAAREGERQAELDKKQLALFRARLPWVLVAAVILLFGSCAVLELYRHAAHERDLAERINSFLADDLITRVSPYKTGMNSESLVEAVKQASPSIDSRFANEPLVAARLHHTIAIALDRRMDTPDADEEYVAAASLYIAEQGRSSPDAVVAQMQRAAMHARDTKPGSLDQARSIYAQQQPILVAMHNPPPELPIWSDYALGLIQMFGGDAQEAVITFGKGLQAAEKLPHFNLGIILTMKQLLAVSDFHLGQGVQAEVLIRQMMNTVQREHYTDKPNLTNLRVNLAQAYMSEQKNKEAIDEITAVYPSIVEQMGAANPLSMTALGVRAQAEANLGLWAAAMRDSLTVHDLAAKTDVFEQSGSLSDAALYACRAGHFTEGEADARAAIVIGRSILKNNKGFESSFDFSLATCELGLGQTQEADTLLSTVNVPAISQMYADPDWNVDYDLTKAEIAFRRGDLPAAQMHFETAMPACYRQGASPYRRAWCDEIKTRLLTRTNSVASLH